MANYIPAGWKMSHDGAARYSTLIGKIDGVVKRNARKFRLQAFDQIDLEQEGLLAAAYAVDSYSETRGSLMGYIQHCVYNALAMVAAEQLAQCRTPHVMVQESVPVYDTEHRRVVGTDVRWARRPSLQTGLEFVDGTNGYVAEAIIDHGPDAPSVTASYITMRRALNESGLSSDARRMAELMASRPPEVEVASRNLHGKSGKSLHPAAAAHYFGWDVRRAKSALAELKSHGGTGVSNTKKHVSDHGVPQQQ